MLARGYSQVKHFAKGVFGWWADGLPMDEKAPLKLPAPMNPFEEEIS